MYVCIFFSWKVLFSLYLFCYYVWSQYRRIFFSKKYPFLFLLLAFSMHHITPRWRHWAQRSQGSISKRVVDDAKDTTTCWSTASKRKKTTLTKIVIKVSKVGKRYGIHAHEIRVFLSENPPTLYTHGYVHTSNILLLMIFFQRNSRFGIFERVHYLQASYFPGKWRWTHCVSSDHIYSISLDSPAKILLSDED